MKPRSFEFTVTMPGDTRLVGAIRGLTTHAAGYARLSAAAGQDLAVHVQRATETAIDTAPGEHPPIDFRFTGDADTLTVVISYEAGAPAARLPSASAEHPGGISIVWMEKRSRHVCHIRQPIGS